MIVAQISDLHIRRQGVVFPHMPHVGRPLRRVLEALHALRNRPSCILATGDLTENGTVEEYQRLRTLLDRSRIPVFLIAGNHDRRDALRSVFRDPYLRSGTEALQYTIEYEATRIIALDTSEPPARGGYLDGERLRWLSEALRHRPNVPTMLAMHHPPFRTGVRAFDGQGFAGRDELERIVRANSQVRRIVCGHVHQIVREEWAGVPAIAASSTAPTFVLHGRGGFRWESGGFLLHRINAGGAMDAKIVRVSAQPLAIGA